MTSSFTWVDFAEDDRRKMAQVIDLFREQDTRDELGLGALRDGFADFFFPGTSTIQTRARYFLFVPWMYRNHEERGTPGAKIVRSARRDEIALIGALADSGEQDGVIGIEKREKLQRLPSSIYWAGLGAWRVRRFPGSQEQYRGAWDWLLTHRETTRLNDDHEPDDTSSVRTWDPELPTMPLDFPKGASFMLKHHEAEYLQHRISELRSTLLSHLINETTPAEETQFPWDHPEAANFPEKLKMPLEHARLFSEAMHGAALLYNLMLAEASRNAEWISGYRGSFTSWSTFVATRQAVFQRWHRGEFWAMANSANCRVTARTRRFVDKWLDLVLKSASPESLIDHGGARELVREREQILKRSRARLGNPHALERWNGSSGAQQLDYRWHRVRTIVADVLRGLGKGSTYAESAGQAAVS